jgi:hypothetical protein
VARTHAINHYHLQVETPEANLSRAMQRLNVSYAVWFNRKYRRVGPLFAGRFRAVITDREKWVAEVNRYIQLNPVRTAAFGLGKRDAAFSKGGNSAGAEREKVRERLRHLRNYRWSSTRAYLAVEAAPSWLTVDVVRAQFGGRTKKDQSRAYRQALEEAIVEAVKESPWEKAVGGLILGGKQFVEVDVPYGAHFEIEIRSGPDDFLPEPLKLYEMPDGLYYPISAQVWTQGGLIEAQDDSIHAMADALAAMTKARKALRHKLRQDGPLQFRAFQFGKYVSPILMGFHRSRVVDSGYELVSRTTWENSLEHNHAV